jgi:hypothetical protein
MTSTRSLTPTPRRSTGLGSPPPDQAIRQRSDRSSHELGLEERNRSSHRRVPKPWLHDRSRIPGPTRKQVLAPGSARDALLAKGAHRVLARSLLAAGHCRTLRECLPRFRIHENLEVSRRLLRGDHAAALRRIQQRSMGPAFARRRAFMASSAASCSARKTRERPGGPLRSTTGSLRVSSSQRLSEMSD